MLPLKQLLTPKNLKVYLPFIIVGAAILLFILLVNGRSRLSDQGPREKAWNVSVTQVNKGNYTPNIILHGITESPRHATLEAAINADVIATLVDEGDSVKKGDILIQLDDREAKLLVRQRQAEVADLSAQIKTEFNRVKTDREILKHELELVKLGQKDLKRQQTLFKKRVGSQFALDNTAKTVQQQSLAVTSRKQSIQDHENRLLQIKARLAKAQALFEKAQLDLERTNVKAPFTGRITKLMVAPGTRMQLGEALIVIYDTQNIETRAQVPSQYIATIRSALMNNTSLKAYGFLDGKRIELQLDRLAGEVERGRGGVDALFTIVNKNNHWALGRSFELLLSLPKINNIYKLPTTALYGGNRIYIVKDKRLEPLTVNRVGFIQKFHGSTYVLIQSDRIKKNDQIITTQLPNARTGLKVKTMKP